VLQQAEAGRGLGWGHDTQIPVWWHTTECKEVKGRGCILLPGLRLSTGFHFQGDNHSQSSFWRDLGSWMVAACPVLTGIFWEGPAGRRGGAGVLANLQSGLLSETPRPFLPSPRNTVSVWGPQVDESCGIFSTQPP
jgi:hypothetical protein